MAAEKKPAKQFKMFIEAEPPKPAPKQDTRIQATSKFRLRK